MVRKDKYPLAHDLAKQARGLPRWARPPIADQTLGLLPHRPEHRLRDRAAYAESMALMNWAGPMPSSVTTQSSPGRVGSPLRINSHSSMDAVDGAYGLMLPQDDPPD